MVGLLYGALLTAFAASGEVFQLTRLSVVPAVLLAAAVSGRFADFLRDWAVFLALIVGYDVARGLVFTAINVFELPWYAAYAIDLERALLFGATWPNLLQDAWRAVGKPGIPALLAVMIHSSHFVFFFGFGLVLWSRRTEDFPAFRSALLWVMVGGVLASLILPTAPPWMAAGSLGLLRPLERIAEGIYVSSVPMLFAGFNSGNPIAAMPSIHAAVPTLCALFALHCFGRRGYVVVVYTLAMFVTIGFLGEHYLVDVLAGSALAYAAYAMVMRRQRLRPTAKSTAPEAAGGSRRSAMLRFRFLDDLNRQLEASLAPSGIEAMASFFKMLCLLLGLGMLGMISLIVRPPLVPDHGFLERELLGRSDLAGFYRGLELFRAGNLEPAGREISRSLAGDGSDREPEAPFSMLWNVAVREDDLAGLANVLHALPTGAYEPPRALMLARAYAGLGDPTRAVGVLEALLPQTRSAAPVIEQLEGYRARLKAAETIP